MNYRSIKILPLFCIGLFSGCSMLPKMSTSGSSTKATPTATGKADIDLFLARGFLGGSDYERYRLVNGALWRECGMLVSKEKIQKKSAQKGDDALPADPNLLAIQRRAEKLSDEELIKLEEAAQRVLPQLAGARGKLPLPGSAYSLSEPGVFEIGVRFGDSTGRLVTSVDAVADREGGLKILKDVATLTELIRGIGPEACQKTFFGLERKNISGAVANAVTK